MMVYEHMFDNVARARRQSGEIDASAAYGDGMSGHTSGQAPEPGPERAAAIEGGLPALPQEADVADVLLAMSSLLAEVRTVEETLATTVMLLPKVFGADRCVALLEDQAERRLAVAAHFGFDGSGIEALEASSGGAGLISEAVESRSVVLVSDAAATGSRGGEEMRRVGAYIGIPLLRRNAAFGAILVEFSEPTELCSRERQLAEGVVRQVGIALAHAQGFNLLKTLRDYGLRIGSKVRVAEVLSEVEQGAIELLQAEGAIVYFLDGRRNSLLAGRGLEAAAPSELATLHLSEEPWRSFYTGNETVAEVQGGAMADAGFARGIIAAIPGPAPGTDLIGALLVVFKDDFSLGPGEPEAVELAASQAATAIEMARRYERQKSAARSLQRGLVMVDMPVLDSCDFAAVYEPADSDADIGGDFFDVFELPDGRIAMTVGDVSGKGAEAAAQTAMAKYMLRAFAMRNARPSSVLFHLNNALVRSLGDDRFSTAVYATYDQHQRTCEVALGGHPSPFVYRHESHAIDRVAPSGMLLGVFADQDYPMETIVLGPGDALIAFTDGLTEARKGAELYGSERLVESVLMHAPGSSAAELVDRVYEDAKGFGIVSDDIVVLTMVCGR